MEITLLIINLILLTLVLNKVNRAIYLSEKVFKLTSFKLTDEDAAQINLKFGKF